MPSAIAGTEIVIAPTPRAQFGAGAVGDTLDGEVLANTPRPPDAADIHAILLAC
jgi:hypothetical protein